MIFQTKGASKKSEVKNKMVNRRECKQQTIDTDEKDTHI